MDRGLALLFAALLWLLLSVCFDFYYALNDDTAMKDILSGVYTGVPDGHNIQMLYPLGWLLSLVYRIAPLVPWYGVFLCGCQFLALGTAACSLLRFVRDRKNKPRLLLAVTAGLGILFLYELVFIQYTVTAGLLAAAALVRLFAGPGADGDGFFKYHAVTALLIVTAFCLRTEMLLLLSPFLLLAALFRAGEEWERAGLDMPDNEGAGSGANIQDGKDMPDSGRLPGNRRRIIIKKYAVAAVCTLAAALVCAAVDGAAYSSPEWREFRRFFDDRTRVYDFYGIPSYEENRAFYDSIGLSEAEYTLLENYNFELDEDIDAETMAQIAGYAAAHQAVSPAGRLYESAYAYVYRFLHGQELIFDLLAVFSYFFLLQAAIRRKNGALLAKLALVFALRTMLWLFLLYRGRTPERITHPLCLLELIMLGMLFLKDAEVLQWKKYQKSAILFLYAIIFLCAAFSNIRAVRDEYAGREEINGEWRDWKAYCRERPDRFYYLDVYSTVAYSEKLFVDTDPAYRNFDLSGGWCVKSPLAKEKREMAGLDGMQEALLSGDAYFVSDHTKEERAPDFLLSYYQDQGREIVIRETDSCGSFSIYQIVETAAER